MKEKLFYFTDKGYQSDAMVFRFTLDHRVDLCKFRDRLRKVMDPGDTFILSIRTTEETYYSPSETVYECMVPAPHYERRKAAFLRAVEQVEGEIESALAVQRTLDILK